MTRRKVGLAQCADGPIRDVESPYARAVSRLGAWGDAQLERLDRKAFGRPQRSWKLRDSRSADVCARRDLGADVELSTSELVQSPGLRVLPAKGNEGAGDGDGSPADAVCCSLTGFALGEEKGPPE